MNNGVNGANEMTKTELETELDKKFKIQEEKFDAKFKTFETFEIDFKEFKADLRVHEANINFKVEKSINRTTIIVCTIVGVVGFITALAQIAPVIIQVLQATHVLK